MISIRIIAWNSEIAWSTDAGYHPRDLERRLMQLTGLARGEVKGLARQIKKRECFTLPLPRAADRYAATSLSIYLEALGAIVIIDEAE